MIKNSLFLLLLGTIVGFISHNVYSYFQLKHQAMPKVQVVKKEQYDVPLLPFRATEEPDFNLSPFPIPEYSANEEVSKPAAVNPLPTTNNDLEYRLNQAVKESEATYYTNQDDSSDYNSYTINDLPPNMQNRIPNFVYESHVFSSNNRDRFISLNGKNYHEGDLALGILKVVKIQPNYTIFRLEGTSFTVPSLSDWKAK